MSESMENAEIRSTPSGPGSARVTASDSPDQAESVPRRGDIGWGRAIATGVAIIVIGFLLVVLVPNRIVLHLTAISHNARTYLAATVSLVVVLLLAWGLRRLQARGLI